MTPIPQARGGRRCAGGQGHTPGEDGGDRADGGGADAQGADTGGEGTAGEAPAAVGAGHAQADERTPGVVLDDKDAGEALAPRELGGQGDGHQ